MPEATRIQHQVQPSIARNVPRIDEYTGCPYMFQCMRQAQFEWDDIKAEANLAKHGIGFRAAAQVFLSQDRIDLDAARHGDGELRRKVIGMIEGRLFVVVYTRRGDVYRLISARRANRKEERTWLDLR